MNRVVFNSCGRKTAGAVTNSECYNVVTEYVIGLRGQKLCLELLEGCFVKGGGGRDYHTNPCTPGLLRVRFD